MKCNEISEKELKEKMREEAQLPDCRILVANLADVEVLDSEELTPEMEHVETYTYKAPRFLATTYGRGLLFENGWTECGNMSKAEVLNEDTGKWE